MKREKRRSSRLIRDAVHTMAEKQVRLMNNPLKNMEPPMLRLGRVGFIIEYEIRKI